MKNTEIDEFLNNNSDESISSYCSLLNKKMEDLRKRINISYVLFVGLVIIFYTTTISKSIFTSVAIGPFSVTNLLFIKELTPPIFALVHLQLTIYNTGIADITRFLKIAYSKLYKLPPISHDEKKKIFLINDIVKLILPFSYQSELNNEDFSNSSLAGCLSIVISGLLSLPVLLIRWFFPFYFEYASIKYLFTIFHENNVAIISAIVSIWLVARIIIYNYFKFYKVKTDVLENK